jgi:hypothetical protein
MAGCGPQLNSILERAPALQEARPLVDDLSEMARIGLEATSYLTDRVAPTTQWRDASLARLDQAAKPKAAVEFAIDPQPAPARHRSCRVTVAAAVVAC